MEKQDLIELAEKYKDLKAGDEVARGIMTANYMWARNNEWFLRVGRDGDTSSTISEEGWTRKHVRDIVRSHKGKLARIYKNQNG